MSDRHHRTRCRGAGEAPFGLFVPTPLPLLAAFAALACAPAFARAEPPDPPRWDVSSPLDAEAGYAQLRWSAPTSAGEPVHWVYELQEGRTVDFVDVDPHDVGQQTSSFVSGLENGDYFYRVRARHPEDPRWSGWSTKVRVHVRHHSRATALALMATGALVFLATAGFLLFHRDAVAPPRDRDASSEVVR